VSELYFLNPSFWTAPRQLLLFAGGIFLVVFLRYLLVSVSYQALAKKFFQGSARFFLKSGTQRWRAEVGWSALSALVFAVLTTLTVWMYQKGFTKVYLEIDAYSLFYFWLSILIVLIGYETYYYWLHRWMHLPRVFRIVHKVHHASVHTSVFTSFSFHPLEAVLQFLFLPLILMVIPLHYAAIGIVLLLMTVSAVINHGAVEIFSSRLGKILIGATHHDLHHKEFKTNFGLYFTFWDRWMKTESKNTSIRMEEATRPTSTDLDDDVVR
jgi:Delta7-sterol 5-desaturase